MGDQYESIGDPAQGDAGAPPPPPPGAPAADAAPDNNNSGYKSAGESVPQPEPVDDQGKQPPADAKPEDVPPPEGAADQSNQPQTDLKSAPQDGAGPPPPEAAAEVPKKKAPVAPVGGPTQVISATGPLAPRGQARCVSVGCQRTCIIISVVVLLFFAVLLTVAIAVPYGTKCFSYCPTYF